MVSIFFVIIQLIQPLNLSIRSDVKISLLIHLQDVIWKLQYDKTLWRKDFAEYVVDNISELNLKKRKYGTTLKFHFELDIEFELDIDFFPIFEINFENFTK